jgi:type II secretory pathway pseudopilin PulG
MPRTATHQKLPSATAAFTLVELAIVIVIVGLLAVSMLSGSEMIKNAEIRSFVSQLSKLNSATSTFRVKYGNLPGDVKGPRATEFGFVTRSGAIGHGDGNGLIESCAANGRALGCETALFWQDLSDAHLIADKLSTTTDAYIDGTAPTFNASNHLPAVKLRSGVYMFTYPLNDRNTYYVGSFASVNATGVITTGDGLTPREANDIDKKLDNEIPNTGTIRAVTNLTTIDPGAAASSTECVVNTVTPFSYNLSGNFSSNVNCQLILSNHL